MPRRDEPGASPPVIILPSIVLSKLTVPKNKMETFTLVLLLIGTALAGAQTDIRCAPNWVCEEPNFRMVEGQIYDASLDLIILEPGVWVDESVLGVASE